MPPNPQVTFTEEILNGKHFLYSDTLCDKILWEYVL